jgi:hypothetical protein
MARIRDIVPDRGREVYNRPRDKVDQCLHAAPFGYLLLKPRESHGLFTELVNVQVAGKRPDRY